MSLFSRFKSNYISTQSSTSSLYDDNVKSELNSGHITIYNTRVGVIHTMCFSRVELNYKSKYKKIGLLPIRIVKSNVSSIGTSSERN